MAKILIADDDEYVRILLRRVIQSLQYEIVGEAPDGEATIKMYRNIKPDILLLDIDMPLKKGTEVLKVIKTEYPDACVIMITSHSELDRVKECISQGAYNYLRKDTPLSRIKDIIQGAVVNTLAKRAK